jgi:predicted CoA-substrate-specific enzyme activase
MITAGCDVGSLTAKAVILNDGSIMSTALIRTGPDPSGAAEKVMRLCIDNAGINSYSIKCCCATGYGRLEIPFADMEMSEISCHGMGAFHNSNAVRTIIDIGGQDCKIISVNDKGLVTDFVMNDKCAAGTGRSLEILAGTLSIPLENLGKAAEGSRKPVNITNKCSIFMELEVMEMMCRNKKHSDIVNGIADAVARRVVSLAGTMKLNDKICVTGGVAKNSAVVRHLEKRLGASFYTLSIDPQLTGAAGAAVFAMRAAAAGNIRNK